MKLLSEIDRAEKGDALYGNASFLIRMQYFESNVKILLAVSVFGGIHILISCFVGMLS